MREIKFRAWSPKKKEMIYLTGSYVCDFYLQTSGVNWGIFKEHDGYEAYMNNNFGDILMQHIGLKDKNGKEIYEGDIFKFEDEVFDSCYKSCGTEYVSWQVENYGVVGFDEKMARYDFIKYKYNENQIEADLHENNDLEFASFLANLEVIGNIYENPELLEVE